MATTLLVVDDDPVQRRLLQGIAERHGFGCIAAASGEEALSTLSSPQGPAVTLVLLDLLMPSLDGLETLKRLRPQFPELPVIVLTAQGGIDSAVNAMKAGAQDFLVKPASPERIQVSIQNALKMTAMAGEIVRLKKKVTNQLKFDDLVGRSPAMRQVVRFGDRAAQSDIPILIEGESGVGKELIARAIQGSSGRAGKPFVTVNCGAIPENLVESILFGHEKGAFTGATDKHAGKFVEADGGTLFLDEIGELPSNMQVKLLRALQEGEIDPVGGRRPVKVDIRLISATNRDLLKAVQDGRFREDLYYRLNVFPIRVPPLRERTGDVPELIAHFVERFAAEENKRVLGIEGEALDILSRYAWPGNVRQLENAVFRAVVLCDGDRLTVADFPQIAGFMGVEVASRAPQAEPQAETTHGFMAFAQPAEAPEPVSPPIRASFAGDPPATDPAETGGEAGVAVFDGRGHLRTIEDVESQMIRLAITRYDGHMSEVARRLGIGRSTLYRKLRELGIAVRESA